MDKNSNLDKLPLTFECIAQVLFQDTPPYWLVFHFQKWAQTLRLERLLGHRRPTRSMVKKNLKTIEVAAKALNAALGCLATSEFLEAGEFGRMKDVHQLRERLHELARRAQVAENSPALSSERGVTKPGRGKAVLPGAIRPHTLCAWMIAEVWKVLHGRYPADRNKTAALAADMFWRISMFRAVSEAPTDDQPGWGNDRLNRWRRHFEEASALREAGSQGLREYIRQLTELASAESVAPTAVVNRANRI